MNFSKCLLIEESSVILVINRGLGHSRSGMLKLYFVEYILLPFLKYVFKKKMDICSQK